VMQGRPLVDWDWIVRHLDTVVLRIWQHVQLFAVPLAAGLLISLLLAFVALRRPGTVGPVTAITGLLYTIPSLAAFAVLRPVFGLSLLTAYIPLTTYTLLILYRNIVAGFRAVPPDVHEAALGMGYTRLGRLLRVELPLAVPLIMAGVRLASVTTIGLVTVASVIGADRFGGLGQLITEGLQTSFPTKIYLGAVLSVVLAFVVDALLVGVERALTPWARARSEQA
jgi:osmoprotectant transport system permease protein